MTEAELLKLIEDGENIRVEFKKSTTEITKDVYDTVCSFSNRDGGIILLGVKDNGEILGVAPDAVDRMKKDFVTSINNGQKINPPLYLQPEACTVDGRTLLVISHQERIMDIADHIVVIAGGQVRDQGAKDDVLPNLLSAEKRTRCPRGMA